MILKTIELIPSDITYSIDSLQSDITNGKYDDILTNFCFLTFTEKGLTLVKQDKSIVINGTSDLSEYVKSSTLSTYALKTDIPDVSKYITETQLNEALAGLSVGGDIDLSDYVTTDSLNTTLSQYALKSTIPSLDGYATESFVTTEIGKINIPDVSLFITENDVNTLLDSKSYASTSDLHSHSNKSILDSITTEKIAAWDAASGGSDIDLSGYAKTSDLDKYALKTDVPSLTGYATESYVTTEIGKIVIPDVSKFITTDNLSEYALKSDIPTDYAKSSEIPDVSNFITESALTNYALKSDIPTDYVKSSEIPDVSNFITEIPAEYITETELNEKGYLTEHQSLDDYAKTADIPDTSEFITNSTLNNMFTIDENGNLIVTINGVTQTYAPIAE